MTSPHVSLALHVLLLLHHAFHGGPISNIGPYLIRQPLQGKHRQDFACCKAANKHTEGINEVVYPYIGAIPLCRLGPITMENLLSERRKRTSHGKPIQEGTEKYLVVVSTVLSDARRNEIPEKNPARMVALPQPRRSAQRVTISRSRSNVAGRGIMEGPTKNGHSREIYLPGDMGGIIRSYRSRKAQETRPSRRKLSPRLFTDEHGQLIHPDTFTKRLRRIYTAMGFPREYHLHTLRHYFVTAPLHCGVDKQTVANLVGHGDTEFLERTYCHPQQAQKEQAADSMRTVLRPDGDPLLNLASAYTRWP